MPLYDYRCTACGREVEVMRGIDAPGPEACESCGGAMTKMLSTPTIHFKGSGWAKKDAAAATAKKTKPKASSSGSDGDSATAGAEAKPDTKAASGSATKDSSASTAKASTTAKAD